MNVHNERMAQIHAALVPGASAISLLLALVYLSAGAYGIQPVLYLIPGGMCVPYSSQITGLTRLYSSPGNRPTRSEGDALS